MYRAPSPNRALFPGTPLPETPVQDGTSHDDDASHVMRLYSLLEKSVPIVDPRLTSDFSPLNRTHAAGPRQQDSRPSLPRSMSYQNVRTSDFSTTASPTSIPTAVTRVSSSSVRRSQPHMQVQTSLLSATQFQQTSVSSPQTPTQGQTQLQTSEATSPVQRTPPRPVLPHMHSYFYSPTPAKPVSPKENRVGVRGTLPRRGSLSSASAAAALAAGPGSSSTVLPSPLRSSGKPQAQGLFGGQDSDY
ncbi:uncharacterized protein FOMMEDRAFT_164679 [Fomitiporia mediterranea MF3/22]|uniref:uncharacterized protein n=1 Tax=Fomitiporia mediterranea (strain MF3/22) TaxID=694068 RepID=UPI00044098BF|nr:uncharacterized protein FOMMEDRAFT_164679 [Fomitiporia mediterranea MF3/22]EJD07808.1 hypothetical protein FOMMEDRAFT_164679 [Fomitiporia mediterranea MF3/22]